MKLLTIGSSVDLTTKADGNWVDCKATPFIQDRKVILAINLSADMAGATKSFKVQGTNDGGTTVVDLAEVTDPGPDVLKTVTGYAQIRVSVATAFTTGTANVYLLGGV